jgi:hypothetical protein
MATAARRARLISSKSRLVTTPLNAKVPRATYDCGSLTANEPVGAVAKYCDSNVHNAVASKPGPHPPNHPLNRMNGMYVMLGIDVGGCRGMRAT